MQIKRDRDALMSEICAIGICAYDTVLYLDTHDCPEARLYLERKKAEYRQAVNTFEESFGPIYIDGHPDGDVQWAWKTV